MVKITKVFFLLILVQLCLGLFILIFPDGYIPLGPNYHLSFTTLNRLLNGDKELLKQVAQNDSLANHLAKNTTKDTSELYTDTSINNSEFDSSNFKPADIGFLNKLDSIPYKIEFADSTHPIGLNHFFSALDTLSKTGKKIHIFHFGDSQIEGDRISSTLREKMQKVFGGYGVGLLPPMEINDVSSSMELISTGNWVKTAIYGNLNKGYKARIYGPLCSVFQYYPKTDSLGNQTGVSVTYKKSISAYAHAKKFEELNLYYNNNDKLVNINKNSSQIEHIKTESLSVPKNVLKTTWTFKEPQNQVGIYFPLADESQIFGASLESKTGIYVDNIAMRGSSGLDLKKMNLNFYSGWIKTLNTKLLIFQYGVNMVPYEVMGYNFYESKFYNELKAIKEANPNTDILVIGCSDVAIKSGTDYITNPNVKKIIAAQKNAAFKAGIPFWNLYKAMGGQNSMSSWVNANPSLAEKDFTHFNFRGARIVGEMLYNALMTEYAKYKKNEQVN
jgi:lysophospholipase L1-like esterase